MADNTSFPVLRSADLPPRTTMLPVERRMCSVCKQRVPAGMELPCFCELSSRACNFQRFH